MYIIMFQAERQAGYEENRKEVAKWQSVVEEHRVATHMTFPLEQSKVTIMTGLVLTSLCEVSV